MKAPGEVIFSGRRLVSPEPRESPQRQTGVDGINRWRTVAVAAMAITLIAGCAEDAQKEGVSMSTPATPSDRPTSSIPPAAPESPSQPPTTPSDPSPRDLIAGRVVRGGSGPCYGVETDDGTLYAVHSGTHEDLAVGTTVRVKISATPSGVDCGAGRPVDASWIEIVR
jgi:hypothetical protein